MVSQKAKLQATQFICDRLEDSGLYVIHERGHEHIIVKEKPEITEFPRIIDVLLPNLMPPVRKYLARFRENQMRRIHTCPIYYKDGKTAFVRMVEHTDAWRGDKSLKLYTERQINQMVHLRAIEKAVREKFRDPQLYYQPQTALLPESIREFELHPVTLDYSHVDSSHPSYGYVHDRPSIDYKLPEETDKIQPAAELTFEKPYHLAGMIPAYPPESGTQLSQQDLPFLP